MKKFVITELEILDEEKFKKDCGNIREFERPHVGLTYDISNKANANPDTWIGEKGIDSYRFKLADQTDDEWTNLKREFNILVKFGELGEIEETVYSEIEADNVVKETLEKHTSDNCKVYVNHIILDEEKSAGVVYPEEYTENREYDVMEPEA
jgi:hypothetical protein